MWLRQSDVGKMWEMRSAGGGGQIILGLEAIVRIWAFTLYKMRSYRRVSSKGVIRFDLNFKKFTPVA